MMLLWLMILIDLVWILMCGRDMTDIVVSSDWVSNLFQMTLVNVITFLYDNTIIYLMIIMIDIVIVIVIISMIITHYIVP